MAKKVSVFISAARPNLRNDVIFTSPAYEGVTLTATSRRKLGVDGLQTGDLETGESVGAAFGLRRATLGNGGRRPVDVRGGRRCPTTWSAAPVLL